MLTKKQYGTPLHSSKLHLSQSSIRKRYTCSRCNQTLSNSSNLKRHLKACEGKFDIACTYCDKVFYRPDVLRLHMMRNHGVDKNAFKSEAKPQGYYFQ